MRCWKEKRLHAGRVDRKSLTLGLEKAGELPIRHPLVSVVIILILTTLAVLGAMRLQADDSLSRLFQSDTADYRRYEAVSQAFPSNEFDVLVAIESDALLVRDNVDAMRDFVTDLQLVQGVTGVISFFSIRDAPSPGTSIPGPLFPADLPEGAAYDALIKKVTGNDIIAASCCRRTASSRSSWPRSIRLPPGATARRSSQASARPQPTISENCRFI